AHDALITRWARLKTWLNANKEFLLWKQRLKVSLIDWENFNRDPTCYLHGPVLDEALRRRSEREHDLSTEERDFIKQSLSGREHEKAARAAERRKRRLEVAGGLAASLAVIGALLFWAWWHNRQVDLIEKARGLIERNPPCSVATALYADRQYQNSTTQGL